ncbi:hypothetical protein V8F20_005598 [Naviculisporaceae sp. PSN 640]
MPLPGRWTEYQPWWLHNNGRLSRCTHGSADINRHVPITSWGPMAISIISMSSRIFKISFCHQCGCFVVRILSYGHCRKSVKRQSIEMASRRLSTWSAVVGMARTLSSRFNILLTGEMVDQQSILTKPQRSCLLINIVPLYLHGADSRKDCPWAGIWLDIHADGICLSLLDGSAAHNKAIRADKRVRMTAEHIKGRRGLCSSAIPAGCYLGFLYVAVFLGL